MKIVASGLTDPGRVRTTNEDSMGLFPELGLYIVADGMGGHAAGEVASRMAIETVREYLKNTIDQKGKATGSDIVRAVKEANHQIFLSGNQDSKLHGMGTTLVVFFLGNGQISLASVGDSRGYLIRQNKIAQLTRDHSLVSDYVERGVITQEEAEHHPLKHVISRALGTNADVEVDLREMPLTSGDQYLLCTDGLSNKLTSQELLGLTTGSGGDLSKACQEMVNAANGKGGEDNITLILAQIKGDQS